MRDSTRLVLGALVALSNATAMAIVLVVGVGGCASGNCRRPDNPQAVQAAKTEAPPPAPLSQLPGAPPVPTATPALEPSATPPVVAAPPKKDQRVFVYKPDGSLQCQMAKGLSAVDMEKQLKGLQVFSRQNRPDGLMHIQVCGQPTGMINVYEIPERSLKEAEARGFKKWELD